MRMGVTRDSRRAVCRLAALTATIGGDVPAVGACGPHVFLSEQTLTTSRSIATARLRKYTFTYIHNFLFGEQQLSHHGTDRNFPGLDYLVYFMIHDFLLSITHVCVGDCGFSPQGQSCRVLPPRADGKAPLVAATNERSLGRKETLSVYTVQVLSRTCYQNLWQA